MNRLCEVLKRSQSLFMFSMASSLLSASSFAFITKLTLYITTILWLTNFYVSADGSTTEHFQEIFVGRCWEYQKFNIKKLQLDQGQGQSTKWVEKNCSRLWEALLQSIHSKPSCEILPSDYKQYFNLANPGMTPRSKVRYNVLIIFMWCVPYFC